MSIRKINFVQFGDARKQFGFTLLEAMIALVVLSVGLLGLAALQARSMQYNHDALTRSEASMLASDIMDRMRNRVYDTATGSDTVNKLSAYTGSPAASCPATGNLTQAQELRCWLNRLQDSTNGLPGGSSVTGTITQTAGTATTTDPTDDVYKVSIQWVDRGRTTDDTGAVCSPSPCMRTQNFAFQP